MGAFKDWLTGLTSKTTPADADELYLRDSSGTPSSKKLTWANLKAAIPSAPGGSTGQVQYNNAGAFAGASGITTTGTELAIASGTKTTSAPVLDLSQTWNNAGVTFTGMKMSITRTAASSSSMFADLQQDGTSRIQLRMDPSQPTLDFMTDYGRIRGLSAIDIQCNTTLFTRIDAGSTAYQNKSNIGIGWCNGAAGFGNDTGFHRNAVGVVEVNSGTAGTFRDLKLRNLIASGGVVTYASFTVATLPSASTSGAGAQAFVTDANATTPRSTVAGGGSNKVNVFSDGTNWLIAA